MIDFNHIQAVYLTGPPQSDAGNNHLVIRESTISITISELHVYFEVGECYQVSNF